MLTRHFTRSTPLADVYEDVKLEKRDVVLKDAAGNVIFEQRGVTVPDFWSETSTKILATKYFRGTLGTPERESSIVDVTHRIANAIAGMFFEKGYGTIADADALYDEITYMLVHQIMAFNSPVWFNVGVKDVPQQVSACFILDVEDDMDAILNWYREEGLIFKGGSGAGVNLSKIRSSKELLNGGGAASGPVSFMRGADASAGTIKSGGKTRRAAKMVVLDADHPDIREFVWCKAHEEKKIRALSAAGFDVGFDGVDTFSVQYQNANNSVRVSDEFMLAVESDREWNLTARTDGSVIDTVQARELWRDIAQAAWECADPGLQFDTTINRWNTTPNAGRIDASNPCSEHMRLANSSCNLASLNLLKFYDPTKPTMFNIEDYEAAARLTFLAQNILIDLADFPTEKIAAVTHKYRDLGLGYANLGALLMSMGVSYDSDQGRNVAAALTAILTASAYLVSMELADLHGPCDGFEFDGASRVIEQHTMYAHSSFDLGTPLTARARELWDRVETQYFSGKALRNSQMTVLAPTGTIGLLMGCDTTGVEPAFDLFTYKKLVGGGVIESYIEAVDTALKVLGIEDVEERPDVFMTAAGRWPLSPESHVKMMAAIQPFISGAISKTVNMPNSATVEDIEKIHALAWTTGLKSIAVYRDGCKNAQPLSGSASTPAQTEVHAPVARQEKLGRRRSGRTISFRVADLEGYITTGEYDDGRLGEVFVRVSKQGSTLAGIVDAWSIALSLGIQHGVPLSTFVEKYINMRFEPLGMTNDPDARIAASIIDYVARRLALDYMTQDERVALGIYSVSERVTMLETPSNTALSQPSVEDEMRSHDAPMCYSCGVLMRPSGACHVCANCGSTSGCS